MDLLFLANRPSLVLILFRAKVYRDQEVDVAFGGNVVERDDIGMIQC
jgi:hypothetical protein